MLVFHRPCYIQSNLLLEMTNQTPLPQLSHDQLQAECYQWFHNTYPEQRGLLHANVNNAQNKIKGNQQKALGVVKGVLDMEYFRNGQLHFFDIKVGKDKFSQAQHEFMAQVTAEGAKCYEIRSLEQFQTIIKEINSCRN